MDTIDQSLDGNNVLNETAKEYLKETAKWTRFLAILGFIGIGLMVFGGLSMGVFGSMASSEFNALPFPSFVFTLIYLGVAALYYFPVSYLWKFSNKMREALAGNNEDDYTSAFENLKSHYKFIGILAAIVMGLYALMFVFGIFGAIFF